MRYFFVIILALFLSSAASTSNAQVNINLNFNNMDSQPSWGPTGYNYVENYYLPDIDIYYNVPQHRYYFFNNGRWRYSPNLPYRYRSYNLYNSYKVVVNDKQPWENNDKYRNEYSKYKGNHGQEPIRDSRDSKYFKNKYHPEHNKWIKEQKQNNGNNKDNNRENNGNGKERNNGRDKGKK